MTKMIDTHFFRELYAELKASWCSIRDVKDILVTSKGNAGKERRAR